MPASTLLTVNPNLETPERDLPVELSIHGRLAIALVFPPSDGTQASKEWRAIMPSRHEMKEIMPVNWPQRLRDLVPEAGQLLLRNQREKLENDVRLASETFLPGLTAEKGVTLAQLQEEYRYGWLLVNTRCFYWDYPVILDGSRNLGKGVKGNKGKGASGKQKKWPRDDCMALCPVIDYFNHADDEGVCLLCFAGVAGRVYWCRQR